jgi:hypothetical protein
MLAGIEPTSLGHRALRLLHHCVLEQCVDLSLGSPWSRALQASGALGVRPQQCYFLACPGEMQKTIIVLDDPSVHVTGHGVHTPTIDTFDLPLRGFLGVGAIRHEALTRGVVAPSA